MKTLHKIAAFGSLMLIGVCGAANALTQSPIYIVNTSSEDYQAAKPTGCAGVTFPGITKKESGYLLAKKGQSLQATKIVLTSKAPLGSCLVDYKSKSGLCTIKFQVVSPGEIDAKTLSANGNCSFDGTTSRITIK